MSAPDQPSDDRTSGPDETTNFVAPGRRGDEAEPATVHHHRTGPTPRPGDSGRSVKWADDGGGESAGSLGTIGSCELLDEISRGGMGIVYRARQRALGRVVALKIILDASFSTAEQVLRFQAEAQAAANLDHPNIVAIYELGEHEGRPYLVMEYIEGVCLSTWRDLQTSRDERRIAELMKSIALAVDHAHEHGVIHRDLKPSNVLVDRSGAPHVVDFGLAKLTTHDSGLTTSGVVLGTPSYMSPEQASGNSTSVGPAADVYGLGAILYELLTGRPPFRADTIGATLAQVATEMPVPPRFLDAAVSRNLEAICLKCLEKDAGNRYVSPRALADDLDRLLQGGRVLARRRIGVLATKARPLLLAGVISGLAIFAFLLTRLMPTLSAAAFGLFGSVIFSLACLAAISAWNELVLPTWLVTRSSHPLAKAAFGLGLVLVTLLFNYPATLLLEIPNDLITSEGARTIVDSVIGIAILAGLVGKLFCLVGAFHSAAQGPLLWSIVADMTAVTLSAGWSGFIRLESTGIPVTPWLCVVAAMCFIVGLERMSAGLEEPDLQRKSRRLRLWIGVVCPALFVAAFAANWVSSTVETGIGILYTFAWLFGLLWFARVIYRVQDRILQRI